MCCRAAFLWIWLKGYELFARKGLLLQSKKQMTPAGAQNQETNDEKDTSKYAQRHSCHHQEHGVAAATYDTHFACGDLVATFRHTGVDSHGVASGVCAPRVARSVGCGIYLRRSCRHLCRSGGDDVDAAHHEASHHNLAYDSIVPRTAHGVRRESHDRFVVLENGRDKNSGSICLRGYA